MQQLPKEMTPVVGVIPARYGSTRFPGKALAMIGDRSMLQRVYERSAKCRTLSRLLVATDDERIREHVLGFGGEVVMTPVDCPTGTDRVRVAVAGIECQTVAVIQGDEPLIEPDVIDRTVQALAASERAVCATPIAITRDLQAIESEHTAKVAVNAKLEALYFSRSRIPFARTAAGQDFCYKHVGLYVYRRSFLETFTTLAQTPLELAESLEQLRMLENGYTVQCCPVDYEAISVDTPEDLAALKRKLGL